MAQRGAAPLRRIVHVDMDAFFASVEQRDRPRLRGRPVVVGGDPRGRGVVAAASYEARRFGIRSAMPCARALALCPEAVFLPPRFARYREASQVIHGIFREATDLMEPLSLDEAYLDVTNNRLGMCSATAVARCLRARIAAATHLSASAGVAANKFVAKIASDYRKPDGLCVVPPAKTQAFLDPQPIRAVPGIGPVTAKRLAALGIATIGDLRARPLDRLQRQLGRHAAAFWQLAHGIDDRPVVAERQRKSISIEDTYAEDLREVGDVRRELLRLAEQLAERAGQRALMGRTLTVKVRTFDFRQLTRSRTTPRPLTLARELGELALHLLPSLDYRRRPVRLLGLGLKTLAHAETSAVQLLLPIG